MEVNRDRVGDLIAGAQRAHTRLEDSLSDLSDAAVREPSLLPSWTRGHVLTHVARNADSHARLLEAAVNGQRVEQYVGGAEGRAADIEAGAFRELSALVSDVTSSAQRLADLWLAVADDVWERTVHTTLGTRAAFRLVWARWREVEIHHVDLDCGYRPSHWPEDFTQLMFKDLARRLEPRLPGNISLDIEASDQAIGWSAKKGAPRTHVTVRGSAPSLVAWLLGRTVIAHDIEALDPEGQPIPLPTIDPWA